MTLMLFLLFWLFLLGILYVVIKTLEKILRLGGKIIEGIAGFLLAILFLIVVTYPEASGDLLQPLFRHLGPVVDKLLYLIYSFLKAVFHAIQEIE